MWVKWSQEFVLLNLGDVKNDGYSPVQFTMQTIIVMAQMLRMHLYCVLWSLSLIYLTEFELNLMINHSSQILVIIKRISAPNDSPATKTSSIEGSEPK